MLRGYVLQEFRCGMSLLHNARVPQLDDSNDWGKRKCLENGILRKLHVLCLDFDDLKTGLLLTTSFFFFFLASRSLVPHIGPLGSRMVVRRANILGESGGSCLAFYDLTFAVVHCHFYYILMVICKSL